MSSPGSPFYSIRIRYYYGVVREVSNFQVPFSSTNVTLVGLEGAAGLPKVNTTLAVALEPFCCTLL